MKESIETYLYRELNRRTDGMLDLVDKKGELPPYIARKTKEQLRQEKIENVAQRLAWHTTRLQTPQGG